MPKYKYITTTLPYINGDPHIGHLLEFVQADSLTRYFRKIQGVDVYFNVGIDEHGKKIHDRSLDHGLDTQKYCDYQAKTWEQFFRDFKIDYSNFYRTTSDAHKKKVEDFWNKTLANGDLYKKEYEGLYCTGCESFKTSSDLVDGICPEHGTPVQLVKEENWFFKSSKYKTDVLEKGPALHPRTKREELKNVIVSSDDISVSRSRKNVPWGIPVPNDSDQTIYVWFDALCNYAFSAGYPDSMVRFERFWENSIQLCGPDNLKFQGGLLQSILSSAKIPHTKILLVHGTVLDSDGRKMSKTLGNVVSPYEQIDKYGLDAVRYYLLAGISTFSDSSWIEDDLVNLYNSDLADDYGNLLARTLHLIDIKKCEISAKHLDWGFKSIVDDLTYDVKREWETFNIHQAVKLTNSISKLGNKYINESKPWGEYYITPLNNLHYLLVKVTELLEPVIPEGASKAFQALMDKKKAIIFPKINSNIKELKP